MGITLKINFVDFWEPFEKKNNFFYHLISKWYDIEITEDPDFLFFSSYGNEYLKYKCVRIFFASENSRPDFLMCDYAISFDYINKRNHFRFPLYQLYIDGHGYYEKLVKKLSIEEARAIWKQKKKFCCMLVSNPNSKKRIEFFNALSAIMPVDSGGRYLNNIGCNVEDKMSFIKDYKFVFAFENSSYPGYTTEKILEPLVVKSIPIYWGNKIVDRDFNKESFINLDDQSNFQQCIDQILLINNNEDMAVQMIMEEPFANPDNEHMQAMNGISKFLKEIFIVKKKLPMAKNQSILLYLFFRKIMKRIILKISG